MVPILGMMMMAMKSASAFLMEQIGRKDGIEMAWAMRVIIYDRVGWI